MRTVPNEYFCPIQANGFRQDLAYRPELTHGSVDFVASSEYISKAPEPVSIVFAIDVSAVCTSGSLSDW
jgi:protein transport protein SEC24